MGGTPYNMGLNFRKMKPRQNVSEKNAYPDPMAPPVSPGKAFAALSKAQEQFYETHIRKQEMILTDLTEKWRWRLDTLDHALQPVVNLRTGICFGYEALIRNYQEAGFETIDDVFDAAFTDHVLHRVDLALRKKAIEKLRQLPWHESVVLFYNVDSRLWDSKDFDHDNAVDLLKRLSFSAERICFEVSEKRPLVLTQQLMDIRRRL